ncbi:MAG TPA: DUF1501 domain-containing protein [Planctomycetota bacterium]|nr:DUF1501 domain-containing protein [Planctomycetota bacterium]
MTTPSMSSPGSPSSPSPRLFPSSLSRRSFLKSALAFPAAATLPGLFARAAFASGPGDEVLVLVRLEGGNDGLNTVVPFADDLYHRARPGIGVKDPVKLTEETGLHPSLGALRAAWDEGALAIVQGVGYPDSSRSHFTSTDIWHTAFTGTPERWSGWAGRALDRMDEGEVPALQLDPAPLSLALTGERVVVPAVADAESFRVRGNKDLLAALVARPREGVAEDVRRAGATAYRTAERLEKSLGSGDARGYPDTDLSRRLWQVARLVEGGLPARVYAVRLSGFDTHAKQGNAHALLLRTLGDALAAFEADLKAKGLDKRVLVMTYSEFGRRVEENRSLGTDHGTAAPLFVMGGRVKGGLLGAHPSLADLDEGDLRFHTDFRRVYATVLDRWLKADSHAVLGAAYAPVPFV